MPLPSRWQLVVRIRGELSGALRDLIDQKSKAMARMKPGRDDPLYFARAEIALGDFVKTFMPSATRVEQAE